MRIVPASHLDHDLTPDHVAWILARFGEREGFFLETVDLPPELGPLPCGLHGPVMGDPPIAHAEAAHVARAHRAWPSRVVDRPYRPSRKLTVIGGPDDDGSTVLYTAYGGPSAPRELLDPGLAGDPAALAESWAFWAEHALSRHRVLPPR